MEYKKIVLSIPHSSKAKGEEGWKGDIEQEIEKWTDTHTEALFAPSLILKEKVEPVVANVSRFFCDVERLLNDPLEKEGQGIFYTSFNGCKREKKHEDYSSAMQYWWDYQEKLSRAMCDHCLILDCHSFPVEVAPDIDFCIGFNEDFSKPNYKVIEDTCEFLEGYGYKVSLNKPYSNSITPHEDYYYNSMMIEVNKKVYLNGGRIKPTMYKVNQMLNYLYKKLLDYGQN